MKQGPPQRPLAGIDILVTRPEHQSKDLVERLSVLGARVHSIPVIEIRPLTDLSALDEALLNLSRFGWLVFTSVNAVDIVLSRVRGLGLNVPDRFSHLRIAAIGPSTEGAVRERGLSVTLVPREYRAEGLLAALIGQGVQGASVLIPRARLARDVLPEGLTAAGAHPLVIPVYDTAASEGSRETLQKLFDEVRIRVVTFTSPSTVDAFQRLAPDPLPTELLFAAIGPITAQAAATRGYPTAVVADRYTVDGLAEAIAFHFLQTDNSSK